MTSPGLLARTRKALVARPWMGAAIACGSLMHALGHTLLAAAGGVLARSLARGTDPMDDRSIDWLRRLGGDDPIFGVATLGFFAAGAKLVGGVLAGWAEARVAGDVGSALRAQVIDRVLARDSLHAARQADQGEGGPSASLVPRSQGDVSAKVSDVASMTAHVREVEGGIVLGVFGEARAVMQLVPLVVLLAWLAPNLAGTALAVLVAFGALVMGTRRALARSHARAARQAETLLGAADEAVRHADLWRTYGAERRIRAHLDALGQAIVTSSATLRARAALLSGTSETLGALALVLTLSLAGAGALGSVPRTTLVPFAIAFFMAYKPLRSLVEGRLARAAADAALRAAVRDDGPPTAATSVDDGSDAIEEAPRRWRRGRLTVESFVGAHGRHAPLDLRLEPGSIAAIVGPTGIGKTSLLRALLGLERPRIGRITWGDEDLADASVGRAHRPFAWVPQDAPVLADTLDVNVGLGRDGAGGATGDARRILAQLGARSLAEELGGAVLVAHRAVSGGERQWIAMARALATDLPVLLLDEPTSSLDPESQAQMLRAIRALRGRRTVVIVTHRPEPLAIADVVVRLESASNRGDLENGTRRHLDVVGEKQIAVEHVRAFPLGKVEREPRRKPVDTSVVD